MAPDEKTYYIDESSGEDSPSTPGTPEKPFKPFNLHFSTMAKRNTLFAKGRQHKSGNLVIDAIIPSIAVFANNV